jgi:hypothetical protein
MKEEPHLNFGDKVYFKSDPTQLEYLVTGFMIRPGVILYFVSFCGQEEKAYDFEISTEKIVVI